MIWIVSAIINLIVIVRMFYNEYRESKSVYWKGLGWLSFWSIVLGPAFTLLIFVIWLTERIE